MINIDNLEKFITEGFATGEYFPLRKEGWIELLTRLREAEKDAARYRWLRDYHIGDDPQSINMDGNSGLDEAIDEAMQCKSN